MKPELKSLVSQRLKLQLVLTLIFAAAGLLFSWLILADSSPLHSYFLWHTALPNLWGVTVFIPYVLAALLVGNPHSPSTFAVVLFTIIQWCVVGAILSVPISKLWFRLH